MFGKILAGVGVALALTATGIYVATGSVPGAQTLGEMFDGPSGCPSACGSKSARAATCPMSDAETCPASVPVNPDALAGLTGGVSAPAPATCPKSSCCTDE